MSANYEALRNAASPEQFCAVLEGIACELEDNSSDLDDAWQDDMAGEPWRVLAKSLQTVADTFALKPVLPPA